jgi:hypothetical protein
MRGRQGPDRGGGNAPYFGASDNTVRKAHHCQASRLRSPMALSCERTESERSGSQKEAGADQACAQRPLTLITAADHRPPGSLRSLTYVELTP